MPSGAHNIERCSCRHGKNIPSGYPQKGAARTLPPPWLQVQRLQADKGGTRKSCDGTQQSGLAGKKEWPLPTLRTRFARQ
jgi:hypothetical protein